MITRRLLYTLERKLPMAQPTIYILHFDEALHHARHYAGCTSNLHQRLIAHASGAGSKLTRVIAEQGITWQLGTVAICTHSSMRRLERHLKDMNNGPEYCQICQNGSARRIAGTTNYPVALIRFPTTSGLLTIEPRVEVVVRFTSPTEPRAIHEWLKHMMRVEKDALGFIPAGGPAGLSTLHDRGQIAIIGSAKEDIGYAAWTINQTTGLVTIHQTVVSDAYRLRQIGATLIGAIKARYPQTPIVAKVRDDLAANHFWRAIGFKYTGSVIHPTSTNRINHYLFQE